MSDSGSSCSSLPPLEPVDLPPAAAPAPHGPNGPNGANGELREGAAHVFKFDTPGTQRRCPSPEPASIWDEEESEAAPESQWDAEVKQETRRLMAPTCQEEFSETSLGYPKWPEEMKDPQYFRNELMKMRNDPRKNPNHGRSMEDQEFWNEAARLPWAKVLLRKEQFWTQRRNVWLQQYGKVLRDNRGRLAVAEELEECSMELKRLVTPLLHYRVIEGLLLTALEEANELGLPLSEFIEGPGRSGVALELWAACERLKEDPGRQAQLLQEELDGRMREAQSLALKEQELQLKDQPRGIIDMEGLRVAMEYGQKCRKDGLVEYHRGNFDEALHSWRQGDVALRRFRAPFRCEVENGMLRELHSSLLRNLSQAALRVGHPTEALDAAERAIALRGGRGLGRDASWDVLGVGLEAAGEIDVKAWFRRHLALEALGDVQEAAKCLQYIEEAATSRADGDRLRQDCQRCRSKLRQRQQRGNEEERRMLQRSLQGGVFSEKRVAPVVKAGTGLTSQDTQPAEAPTFVQGKALTRDGAADVLEDLLVAYSDADFLQRVDKLSRDVAFDALEFAKHLARLSFEAQQPILKKWGFEASITGAQEMKQALKEQTQRDTELEELSNKVSRALYGSPDLMMYERVKLLLDVPKKDGVP